MKHDQDTYYDEWSEGYEELHKEEQLAKARIIRNKLELKKTDKLLDVACGTGLYLGLFDCQVMGVDPSKGLLERNPFPHKQAFAEELPFPDNQFDIVICITAIHIFTDIEKGLLEMNRVGKDLFAFSILRASSKRELIDAWIRKHFTVDEIVREDKDDIYFCRKL